jgi:hypothetical protein
MNLQSFKITFFLFWTLVSKGWTSFIYEIELFEQYWIFRQKIKTLEFNTRKLVKNIRSKKKGFEKEKNIYQQITALIFIDSLGAVLIVAICLLIDIFWANAFQTGLWNIWFNDYLNSDSIDSLLGTSAGVSGAFLALYFTTIGLITSTSYATVSTNMRRYIVEDEVNIFYIKRVSYFCVITLILLAIHSYRLFHIGIYTLIFVSVLGISSIFSFLKLGNRIFSFYSPMVLFDYIETSIVESISEVTVRGSDFQDNSFQNHYYQKVANELQTLGVLSNLVANTGSKNTDGEEALKVSKRILRLLLYYARQKSMIPAQSYWYEKALHHKDYLLASSTELDLMARSAVTFQAEQKPDYLWFEKRLNKHLLHILKALKNKGEHKSIAIISQEAINLLKMYSEDFYLDEALFCYSTLYKFTSSYLKEFEAESLKDPDFNFVLSTAEAFSLYLPNILLGLSKGLENFKPDHLAGKVNNIDWLSTKSLYSSKLPQNLCHSLERMAFKARFEKAIEGKSITPDWYLHQVAAIYFTEFITENIKKLTNEYVSLYTSEVDDLISQKLYFISAQILIRGIEYKRKADWHLNSSVKKFYVNMKSLQKIPDKEINIPDWGRIEAQNNNAHQSVIAKLGKILPNLFVFEHNSSTPDYFGNAFTLLCHEFISSLSLKDIETAKIIYPYLLLSTLKAVERVRGYIIQYNLSGNQIALMFDPLIDLFSLTGYAITYSELYNNPLIEYLQNVWQSIFSQFQNQEHLNAVIKLAVDFVDNPKFVILPRETSRYFWKSTLERDLQKFGIQPDRIYDRYYSESSIPTSSSALINVIAEHYAYTSDWAVDIFVIYILEDLVEIEDSYTRETLRRRLREAEIESVANIEAGAEPAQEMITDSETPTEVNKEDNNGE